MDYKCPVCGSSDEKHDQEGEHGFYVSSRLGEPIAMVVSVQRVYPDAGAVARRLALAQSEMARHFGGKQFSPFLPHASILNTEGSNSVILGHAYVTQYITFELTS